MNIIQKQTNPSGAYPPIQSWQGETPPGGYYEVADGVTLTDGGFGAPTVENGIVTAFTGDATAFEAWKASLPELTPPVDPPTTTDMAEMLLDLEFRTSLLEMGVNK